MVENENSYAMTFSTSSGQKKNSVSLVGHTQCDFTIDISHGVDYPYTRFLPVTSCVVESAAIYIMAMKI
jgi:hypothetical protein